MELTPFGSIENRRLIPNSDNKIVFPVISDFKWWWLILFNSTLDNLANFSPVFLSKK